jgi:hypothetical protein
MIAVTQSFKQVLVLEALVKEEHQSQLNNLHKAVDLTQQQS